MRETIHSLSGRIGYHAMLHQLPPAQYLERIAGNEDIAALNVIEALTDDWARDDIGQIQVAPANERRYGEQFKPVLAAYAHWDTDGGTFSDGSYGVFCFALNQNTAKAHAMHSLGIFFAATNEVSARVQLSLCSFKLAAEVVDLRTMDASHQRSASSEIGKRLRAAGVAGVLFRSPLHDGGECVAAFKANVIADYVDAANVELIWNGDRVDLATGMDSGNVCDRKT